MLESTLSRNIFLGDGAATVFPFAFRVWDASQLFVVVTSPEGVTTAAEGWTASLDEYGGTVRYLHEGAPLAEGWKLAIVRDMPFVQEVDLVTGTRFDPEVIEIALDMAAAERQQLLERLARAVVVEPTDERGPEALLADISSSRDTAVTSAASAEGCAKAAAESASAAAGSAAIATEQREAACICAGEAQAARDVAIAQTEAANKLMEAELAKVNVIVAANRTDQEAAVNAARAWAEKAPGVPVAYDEDGNPFFSARHWADKSQKIAIEAPTAEKRGSVRVGRGLHLVAGADGVVDVLEPVAGLAISETEGAVAAKAVTLAGFVSHAGARLCLLLAEANTAEAPALAVNPDEGGEALPILWAGAPPAPGELAAGLPYLLVCDGAAWHVTAPRPDGTTIASRPDGNLAALGGNLLYNKRLVIEESGDFVARATGWHRITCIGGGGGGGRGGGPYSKGGGGGAAGGATSALLPDGTLLTVEGGGGGAGGGQNGTNATSYGSGGGGGGGVGEHRTWHVYLRAGETIALVIGAGGTGATEMSPNGLGLAGAGTRGGNGPVGTWVGGPPGLGGMPGGGTCYGASSSGAGGAGGNGAMGPLGDAMGAGGGGGGGHGISTDGPGGKSLANAGQNGSKTLSGVGGDGGNGGVVLEYYDPDATS